MASIDIKDVTEGKVDGNGIFDQIMQSTNAQLLSQHQSGRITGPEYASVYLGALQGAMSQAIQYVLGRQQADKTAELLAKQILTEAGNTANTLKQGLLLDEELNSAFEKTKLLQEQIENEHVRHANTLTDGTTPVNGLVEQEKNKMVAEIAITDQKRFTEEAQILDTPNGLPLAGLLKIAKDKALKEVAFVNQKILTEEAQIHDTLSDGTVVYNTSLKTGLGALGKQQVLVNKQTDGFDRDAEQKVLKAMLDSWNINQSLQATPFAIPTELDNLKINSVVLAARNKVSI